MTLIKILRGNLLAMASLACLMTGVAHAQNLDETGIIRITDMPAAAAHNQVQPVKCDQAPCDALGQNCLPSGACAGNGCDAVGCDANGCCPNGYGKNGCGPNGCGPNGSYGCHNGVCGNCNGNCPNCQCGNGYGCPGYGCHKPCLLTWLGCQPGCGACGQCGDCNSCRGKLSKSARCIMAWLDPCSGVCSYSPMHGFAPPNKRPYFRQPVSYQHNYPANWVGGVASGYHGHRPAVYTPTDTTQLGYYYQKVPTWVPVPGAIPPAPQPAEWHHYGSIDAGYVVAPVAEGEVKADKEVAPEPPVEEEAEVETLNLERPVASPRLLPILDTQP